MLRSLTGRMALLAALLGVAVLILAFAHAWDSMLPGSPRAKCFETFGTAQWPKWIGCAMAAHESLAAGLIGLWAAIFAAWLAYSGIKMQIDEDRRKTAIRQIAVNYDTHPPSVASVAAQSRGIPPLFKVDTVNIAVSASKDGKLRVVYGGGTTRRSARSAFDRILPGARSQSGPPHRYL
jgi:hypothetical protein